MFILNLICDKRLRESHADMLLLFLCVCLCHDLKQKHTAFL